jgi:hypothetical protein
VQRQKIQPVVDVPLVLEMETVFGQECSSRFNGVEWRYNVLHQQQPCYIYLPAEGRDAIQRAQPQVGDMIELVKQKRGNSVVFNAQRAQPLYPDQRDQQRQAAPVAQAAQYNPPPQYAQTDQRPGGVRMLAPRPPLPVTNPPHVWAHRHAEPPPAFPEGQPQEQNQQRRPEPPPPPPPAANVQEVLTQCLHTSFDAWEETRAYALAKGVALDFTSEDVRATALSIFISAQQRERYNR